MVTEWYLENQMGKNVKLHKINYYRSSRTKLVLLEIVRCRYVRFCKEREREKTMRQSNCELP